jgi:hypothetical protein
MTFSRQKPTFFIRPPPPPATASALCEKGQTHNLQDSSESRTTGDSSSTGLGAHPSLLHVRAITAMGCFFRASYIFFGVESERLIWRTAIFGVFPYAPPHFDATYVMPAIAATRCRVAAVRGRRGSQRNCSLKSRPSLTCGNSSNVAISNTNSQIFG